MIRKSITSKDGGIISYYQTGKGPGLILLHGGLETSKSHSELAEALSDTFEIYLPDRRGRGLSSPLAKDSYLQTEMDDLESLARETGASFIFAVSSGALITLRLALKSAGLVRKVALYEPPLTIDRARFDKLVERFKLELDQNDIASAFVTALKATGMEPFLFRYTPWILLKPLVNMLMSLQDAKARKKAEGTTGDEHDFDTTLRQLVPTMKADFGVVAEMEGSLQEYSGIEKTRVLMISGTASEPYLINTCFELHKVIPRSKHTQLKGLNHLGSGNKEFDGHPDVVAKTLKDFFADGELNG